jgi:signal transduction histidine kinase
VNPVKEHIDASDDLATIGHEIRNAATPVAVVARLLGSLYGDDPQLVSYGRMLSRQADLLAALATRLAWSAPQVACANAAQRIETDGMVDICELVEHSVQVAQANVQQHRAVHIDVPIQALWIHGEFGRLSQVFVNLLINALRYTSSQGSVRICAARAGRHCYVRVSDDGIGIAPEDLGAIFTRYARADDARSKAQQGMGVGLAVVREIVTAYGGSVTAFSAGRGCGAEFVVRLPVAPSPIRTSTPSSLSGA